MEDPTSTDLKYTSRIFQKTNIGLLVHSGKKKTAKFCNIQINCDDLQELNKCFVSLYRYIASLSISGAIEAETEQFIIENDDENDFGEFEMGNNDEYYNTRVQNFFQSFENVEIKIACYEPITLNELNKIIKMFENIGNYTNTLRMNVSLSNFNTYLEKKLFSNLCNIIAENVLNCKLNKLSFSLKNGNEYIFEQFLNMLCNILGYDKKDNLLYLELDFNHFFLNFIEYQNIKMMDAIGMFLKQLQESKWLHLFYIDFGLFDYYCKSKLNINLSINWYNNKLILLNKILDSIALNESIMELKLQINAKSKIKYLCDNEIISKFYTSLVTCLKIHPKN